MMSSSLKFGSSLAMVKELVVIPKYVLVIRLMAACVVLQGVLVITGSALVLSCYFEPDKALFEYDQLVRLMYLYDFTSCNKGKNFAADTIGDIMLANDTFGLNVISIKYEPTFAKPLTKFTSTTQTNLKVSIAFHILWICSVIAVAICAKRHGRSKLVRLKLVLGICYYFSLFMLWYDLSMAVVYAAHIQQSLTKGMILRHSGTNIMITIAGEDDFGGWVPIGASVMWLRGILFFGLNVFFMRYIHHISKVTRKREYTKIFATSGNTYIPDPDYERPVYDDQVLVYNANDERVNVD